MAASAIFEGTAYRFFRGDDFVLRTFASSGTLVTAFISVLYDDGGEQDLTLRVTASSTRTVMSATSSPLTRAGVVVGCRVTAVSPVKRAQLWCLVRIGHPPGIRKQSLCLGYVYDEKPLGLGVFEDILSGKGFLNWIQEGNDVAGSSDTTVNLATTNARRIVRQILVKYHADGNAATRTVNLQLRDIGDTSGPTGFAIDADTWISPTLTLIADEEGIIHVGEHGFLSVNDEGTLSYADNSSAPNPFPLELEEGETGDLIVNIGSGQAGDDYDVFVQYEEWLEA